MKVRIVALAAIILALAIGAWWWVGSNPPALEVPAETVSTESSSAPAVEPRPPSVPTQLEPQARPTTPPATASAPGRTVGVAPTPVPLPSGVRPSIPMAASAKPGTPAGTEVSPPPANTPPTPGDPELAPKVAIDVDAVGLMLRDYRTRMGENPVGTNAEIMKAVMGGNPKQARFGPPEGQSLNGHGELVDRWGTPYFFHQLSSSDTEVRSAGPDRVMWTNDDVLAR